jgi:hypothetical protein
MKSITTHHVLAALFVLGGLLLPATICAQTAEKSEPEPTDESASVEATLDSAATSGVEAEARSRRVAVVALGEGAKSGSVIQTLLNLLDSDGFEVVGEERLRRQMAASLVPKTPAEVSGQFVGLTTRIGNGIEKFFYKGNEAALELLTPVFNLGMANPEVLARRPDFARQIFEAGLVMIRAYRGLGQADDARRLARALVETFPGFDTRTDSVPPPVAQLLVDQREALRATGSSLEVRMIRGEGCQALVNGTMVGEGARAVASNATYFVTMECGAGAAPLWRVQVPDKGNVVVPVASIHPLDYVMPSASFRHRKLAEAHLEMVSFWTDSPRVLGVADAEASDSVVLVHMGGAGEAGWSDRADEKTVSRMLVRVMNDYGGSDGLASQDGLADGTSTPIDWLSWSMVGGGVAVAGVSTWGLVAASTRAEELRCSPDIRADSGASGCAGVTPVYFANSDELDAAETELDAITVLSGVGLAAGLGLAGWGVYRLALEEAPPYTSQQDQPPPKDSALRFNVGVSHAGAQVAASIAF